MINLRFLYIGDFAILFVGARLGPVYRFYFGIWLFVYQSVGHLQANDEKEKRYQGN